VRWQCGCADQGDDTENEEFDMVNGSVVVVIVVKELINVDEQFGFNICVCGKDGIGEEFGDHGGNAFVDAGLKNVDVVESVSELEEGESGWKGCVGGGGVDEEEVDGVVLFHGVHDGAVEAVVGVGELEAGECCGDGG